ncbi:hypothetical protein SAMN04488515_0537 [Cognatiyoonia koreensis]|uniref:Uncharacterized protein n=1 Tax=Cognatiyoonia koreensis TaxID=364200 RepID=A0A1I0NC34_9RHOB|nr:hypothetical protein [Cognatiyoonia koreensis]SEV98891.1 hypothetical protein SAMN04488515_0537 [Cognatiyoonia koreensis]
MLFIENISFLDVCLALVTLAVAERLVVQYLPEDMVGPEGWLLKTNN